MTGILWTPTPTAWLLQYLFAIDPPLGFTTGLQPSSWSFSLEDRLPAEFLEQGMALVAQNTAKGTSAPIGRT